MTEQMVSNKLINRQKERELWGADQTSFLRLNRATAAPVTLLQICPPSFQFNCSGNNSLGQAIFNTKWCKSCKRTEKTPLCMSTIGLWAILARGAVNLFTRVSGMKCVFIVHFTSDIFFWEQLLVFFRGSFCPSYKSCLCNSYTVLKLGIYLKCIFYSALLGHVLP